MSIIKNVGNLNKKIVSVFKSMAKVNTDLAEIAGSVLWHMGTHRDPRVLNAFYSGLPENYKAGFKRWIVQVSTVAVGDLILEPKVSDLPFTMSKDAFSVKVGTKHMTDAIALYCEEHQDDEGFGRFMDINTDKVKDPFNVLALDKALKQLVTKANKDDSEVSPEVRVLITELVSEFERKAKGWLEEAASVATMRANVVAMRTPTTHEERPAVLN